MTSINTANADRKAKDSAIKRWFGLRKLVDDGQRQRTHDFLDELDDQKLAELHAIMCGVDKDRPAIYADLIGKFGADELRDALHGMWYPPSHMVNGSRQDSRPKRTGLGGSGCIYVYTYPHYLQPTDPASDHDDRVLFDRTLLKVGRTSEDARRRIRQQRNTGAPEPAICLRVYAVKNAKLAENLIHQALDCFGHGRSTAKGAGREWFLTSLEALDALAEAMGLEDITDDNQDGDSDEPLVRTGGRRRITEEQENRIKELLRKGAKQHQIAREVGVSRSKVSTISVEMKKTTKVLEPDSYRYNHD